MVEQESGLLLMFLNSFNSSLALFPQQGISLAYVEKIAGLRRGCVLT